jgi:hypothetical protein
MLVLGTASSSSQVATTWEKVSSSLQWNQVSPQAIWSSTVKL